MKEKLGSQRRTSYEGIAANRGFNSAGSAKGSPIGRLLAADKTKRNPIQRKVCAEFGIMSRSLSKARRVRFGA